MTATNNTISDDTEDLFENLNELAASVESHTEAPPSFANARISPAPNVK